MSDTEPDPVSGKCPKCGSDREEFSTGKHECVPSLMADLEAQKERTEEYRREVERREELIAGLDADLAGWKKKALLLAKTALRMQDKTAVRLGMQAGGYLYVKKRELLNTINAATRIHRALPLEENE